VPPSLIAGAGDHLKAFDQKHGRYPAGQDNGQKDRGYDQIRGEAALSFFMEPFGVTALATDHQCDVDAEARNGQAGLEVEPVRGALRGQCRGIGGTFVWGQAVSQIGGATGSGSGAIQEAPIGGRLAERETARPTGTSRPDNLKSARLHP